MNSIKTFVLTEHGFICRLGGEEDSLEDGVNAIIIDGGEVLNSVSSNLEESYSDEIKQKALKLLKNI